MNFFSNYRFTLDIQKSKSQASLPVHYGDTGNRFYITLTDGGNPYIIPDGCRVDIYINKPAPHNPIVNACVIENNSIVRYEFNKNTASVEGMHKCELRLYSSDGRLITTPSFVMVVDQRVVYDDEIGTEEDFQKLYAMQVIANEEERIATEDVRVDNENKRIEAEIRREKAYLERSGADYDLYITTDDEFDKCLYALYKDDDNLTRDEAIINVANDGYFNSPDPNFNAKRVLVKGVTFKKKRGYDDVRLHIFQPSIEYIKFADCRWETSWKVSGARPSKLRWEPASEFDRADDLHLTIEGISITADNIEAATNHAEAVGDKDQYWGIGLLNVKHLENCQITHPEVYKLTSIGFRSFDFSVQYFDSAINCALSGFWDGKNLVNCSVDKVVKRCTNVVNVASIPVYPYEHTEATPLDPIAPDLHSCANLVNLYGDFAFTNCKRISASKEDLSASETSLKADAANKYRALLQANDALKNGQYYLYAVGRDNQGAASQTYMHVRSSVGNNEIPLRTGYGTLLSSREWSDTNYDYSNKTKWSEATLMPRDYIDRTFKKHTQFVEGYYFEQSERQYFSSVDGITDAAYTPAKGCFYIDKNTRKVYHWDGSKYRLISLALGETNATAYPGDKGKALDERVSGIEQYLGGDNFVVDDSIAYQKVVPKNACERARILTIGGMSYKSKNLIQMVNVNDSPVDGVTTTHKYYVSLNYGHIKIIRSKSAIVGMDWFETSFGEKIQTYLPKGTYTLSFHNVVNSNFGNNVVASIQRGTTVKQLGSINSGLKYTFTLDNTTKVFCRFSMDDSYSSDFDQSSFECDIMLNAGDTAEPFESVGIQDARVNSIKICGANLAEMVNGTYNLLNEGVATPYNATLNDGHIRINKMVSDSPREVSSRELMQYTAVKLPEGAYTLSFTNVNMSAIGFVGLYVMYDGTEVVSGVRIDNGYTLSISIDKPTTIKYGFYMIDNETYMYDGYLECDVMLNNGNSVLPFKPFIVNYISVPTTVKNQGFYGLGIDEEIYNYYDWKNKKFYAKCKKVVFDGSDDESWMIDSGCFKTIIPDISTVLGGSGIAHLVCDKYQQDFGDNLQDATPSIKDLHFYGRSSWFGYGAVVFRDSTVNLDVNEWRTRLAAKPIELIYSREITNVTDLSNAIADDGIIDVEGCGTITAVNDYNLPTPSSIKYLVTYPKEV